MAIVLNTTTNSPLIVSTAPLPPPFDPVAYFQEPRGWSSNVAKCASTHEDGSVTWIGEVVCHAFLNSCRSRDNYYGKIDKSTMTGLYSSLWNKEDTLWDDAVRFWAFLFDEKISPYRPLLKGHRIIKDNNHNPIAFYLTVDDDTSAQYFANLCIATRIPYEHPGSLKAFSFFVKRGFTPHEAFIFIAHLKLVSGDQRTYFMDDSYKGHFPLDSDSHLPLARFVNARPQLSGNKLRRHEYTPCNDIWQKAGKESPIKDALKKGARYTGIFVAKFRYEKGAFFEHGIESDPEKVIASLMEIRDKL
jgi:hypothetical protein